MLDFIMRLLGYENIRNIKIPTEYTIPGVKKLQCKATFFQTTGQFLDKVVVNNDNVLVDGYTTYILNKWLENEYIKVVRIDTSLQLYKTVYKNYKYR
jgi:hypothetical protein